MSKAEKGKAKQAEGGVKANKTKEGKEKFVWSKWDALLYDFLTAIQEAGVEAGKNKENFSERLLIQLNCDADLVTKVRTNPTLAKRVINSLPCGRTVCRQFIREINQKK